MSSKQLAFTAPHRAASEAGMAILECGGTATEAMVAAAAVISVVYPHMNSIGGDGFWLIHQPDADVPIAIDACGRSASDLSAYTGKTDVKCRGSEACITQAGTIAGWQSALLNDAHASLPVQDLLAPAIDMAESGITVTASMAAAINKVLAGPDVSDSFERLYAPEGHPLQAGDLFCNPALAETFRSMAKNGLDDFYRGRVGDKIATTLHAIASPLTADDHRSTRAGVVTPLTVQLDGVRCFNLPAPTQGVHSLQILAQMDRRKADARSAADWAHLTVEATKQSFADRPVMLADPATVPSAYHDALSDRVLTDKAANIDMDNAREWPFPSELGDTVWMGACDARGQLVSFIQSIYWEFGSAVVIEGAGFVWNNRGISFSLQPGDINELKPNKKPRHTLNPAMALFGDGRRLSYGTMGGEGQPQTQATLFSRFVWQGMSLSEAIAGGRWLLGRTWGENSDDLKVEQDIAAYIGDELTARGHQWQTVPANNEMMGHAGAIFDDHGVLTAATDPRSDGKAMVLESQQAERP